MSFAIDINRDGIHRLLVEKRHPDGFYLTVMFDGYTQPGPPYFHPLAVHLTQAELEQLAWGIAELPGSTMYDGQDEPGEADPPTADERQLDLVR
jgi:hypothetical protein